MMNRLSQSHVYRSRLHHAAKRGAALLLCWSLSVMLLPLQTPATQAVRTAAARQRKGSIKGRVVNDSGQPFANAVVYVSPLSGTDNDDREVLTEEDGSFLVKDLSANPYQITCKAAGYVEEENDDASAYHLIGDSVSLRLRKGGVITGMVTDAKGAPIENAKVNIMRLRDGDEPVIGIAETYDAEVTDDRGIYRLYGLQAGAYAVFVNRVGIFEDEESREEVPIYFPSASREGAQIVKVNLGEEVGGINIIYRSERGHSISGQLSGALKKGETSSEAFVKLIHAQSGTVEASGWKGYRTDRAFVFQGVPDGEYYLLAQDNYYGEVKAASAPRQVVVKGGNVSGIELVLVPFASLEGRVSIEALPETRRPADCQKLTPSFLEEVIVKVSGNAGQASKQLPAWLVEESVSNAPDEKGNFVLRSIVPGQYHFAVGLIGHDLYIRTVALRPATAKNSSTGARNALQLKPGERLTGVAVTLAQGAAQLRGRIAPANPAAKLPARLRVYLVPAEAEYADEEWRFAQTEAQSDGTFAFTNLAPGQYRFVLRATSKEGAGGSPDAKLWEAAARKLLQREAASANRAVALQTCQQINEYSLLYPLATAPGEPPAEKAQQPEGLRPKPQAAEPRPANRKAGGIQKRNKNP